MTEFPLLKTGAARRLEKLIRRTDGVEIPYGLITGAAPWPVLLITAGVHWSER